MSQLLQLFLVCIDLRNPLADLSDPGPAAAAVTFLRRGVEGVNLKFKNYSGIVNLTLNLTKKNQSESNQ